MAGGVLSGRCICGMRARAVLGALLISLLLASSDGARGSEDKAAVDLPGEAEVAAAAEAVSMEEEPLHTVADTGVATALRHPSTPEAPSGRPYQSPLRGRRVGTLLLLASILALYGATRWAQAGRLASEASAAAAARSQALQGTLAQYEAQSQLAEQLSKQLAEKRAGTTQFQAEVETVAKQTEETEKELIAELMQHASQGVDTGSLLKALSEEAKNLENETEELQRKVHEFAQPAAEGTLLAKAHEEQADLDAKRRELMEKKGLKAVVEAPWEAQLKSEREELMTATEKTSHELRAVEQRKLQMRVKIIDNMKRALAASSDPELKDALAQRLTALKLEVAERQAAGHKGDETDAAERSRKLEQLKMDVEKAREEEKRLAELLGQRQQAFLDKLAPVEEGIEKLGKLPVCLGRRRKADELAVLTKRDERMCSSLVCEAMQAHERLEGATQSFAAALQQLKTGKLEAEMRALQEKAAESDTTEEERAFLEHRVKQLQEDLASLVPNAIADAKSAEQDMMLALEMRNVLHYSSALHFAAAMQQQLDRDPENKELQDKVLRQHMVYEQARLVMMRDLDLALDIRNQKSHGREIFGMIYEKKTDDILTAREQTRIVTALAESRERHDVTAKRRRRLRKKLALYKSADPKELESKGITSTSILHAKMQLLSETAQLQFYNARMKRLQDKLKNLHGEYADKLEEAKDKWREARQFYPSVQARRYALGGDPASFDAGSFSQRNLNALEEFQSETEEELKADEWLKDVVDDEGVSDEDLLELPETTRLSLHQIFSADTTGGEKEVTPKAASPMVSDLDEEPQIPPKVVQTFTEKLKALEGEDVSSSDDDDKDEEDTDDELFDKLYGRDSDSGSASEAEDVAPDQEPKNVVEGITEEPRAAPPAEEPEVSPSAAEGITEAEHESSQQSEHQGESTTTPDGGSDDSRQAKHSDAEEASHSVEGSDTSQEEIKPFFV